jgi:hypothetical protein
MLSAATLGMAIYGAYSVVAGLIDLLGRSGGEVLVDLGLVAFGLILLLAAAFVRVVIPGGLALAIGALLGLQALSIYSDFHIAGSVAPAPQLVRAGYALVLVGLAHFGARAEGARVRSKADGGG